MCARNISVYKQLCDNDMAIAGYKMKTAAVVVRALVLVAIGFIVIEQEIVSGTIKTNGDTKFPLFNDTSSHPFDAAVQRAQGLISASVANNEKRKVTFDVKTWNRTTAGGLSDSDRVLLSTIYGQAESVFEYGLGESTYIAHHMGVPRYAGIDSDATWVANARDNVPNHFRFYFADIGPTGVWGYPNNANLSKNVLDYQIAPLMVEPMPFDVYMVDGRWRLACMLVSFLHASARGADPSQTTVLLHDCTDEKLWQTATNGRRRNPIRNEYRLADHLLDLVNHSGALLCVYKRKPTTTDADLLELWEQTFATIL